MILGQGGEVQEVSPLDLGSAISARMFRKGFVLFLLSELTEKCYELLLRHESKPFPEIVVLIVFEDSARKSALLEKLSRKIGPKRHRILKPVPSYKEFENSSDFVVREARRLGSSISLSLAKKVVSDSGSDLGFLSFQV